MAQQDWFIGGCYIYNHDTLIDMGMGSGAPSARRRIFNDACHLAEALQDILQKHGDDWDPKATRLLNSMRRKVIPPPATLAHISHVSYDDDREVLVDAVNQLLAEVRILRAVKDNPLWPVGRDEDSPLCSSWGVE